MSTNDTFVSVAITWATVISLFIAAAGYAHVVARKTPKGVRWAALGFGFLGVMSIPYALPSAWVEARFMAGMFSMLGSIRLWQTAIGAHPKSGLHSSFFRFLAFYFTAAESRWVTGTAERSALRQRALTQLGRACTKALLALALFAGSTAYPELIDVCALRIVWLLATSYALVTGVFDLAASGAMLVGIEQGEVFNKPFMSDSPHDFWSRRWNMTFRDGAYRVIFRPLYKRAGVTVASLAVFVFSALMHEYLVVVSLGSTKGHMTAFFLLHGLVAVSYNRWSRARKRGPFMPRPLGIVAHFLWFAATVPLFFEPVLQVFPVHTWRLW